MICAGLAHDLYSFSPFSRPPALVVSQRPACRQQETKYGDLMIHYDPDEQAIGLLFSVPTSVACCLLIPLVRA